MLDNVGKSKPIGIVGLGLIGGSLGLDLQSLGWKVNGLVNRNTSVKRAKERSLATEISTDPQILSNCCLVILALPLEKLLNPSSELINALPQTAVITDVGSVKEPVLKVWGKLHPRFIGSHPMAGTEKFGIEAGEKNLFKNRPWISTPNKESNLEALETIHKLALSLNSNWITTTCKNHDQAVALISHVPVIISAALLRTAGKESNSNLLALSKELASTGFADTTRIGGGNPELGKAMAATNKKEILKVFSSYRLNLDHLEKLIRNEQWDELKKELEETKDLRTSFTRN